MKNTFSFLANLHNALLLAGVWYFGLGYGLGYDWAMIWLWERPCEEMVWKHKEICKLGIWLWKNTEFWRTGTPNCRKTQEMVRKQNNEGIWLWKNAEFWRTGTSSSSKTQGNRENRPFKVFGYVNMWRFASCLCRSSGVSYLKSDL